jgi:hypothetical protein
MHLPPLCDLSPPVKLEEARSVEHILRIVTTGGEEIDVMPIPYGSQGIAWSGIIAGNGRSLKGSAL